jgi:hypothetical protein
MSEWLTYAQVGERLGLSAEAARHRARRLRWRTQPGNDGKTLVLLPGDVEPARPRPPVRTGDRAPVHTHVQPAEIARLAGLLERADARADAAQVRADAADERADRAQARTDAAETRADRAEATVMAERTRADQAEAALGAERARANTLRDKIEVLQADAVEAEAKAEQAEARGDRAQAELERARAAGIEALQAA